MKRVRRAKRICLKCGKDFEILHSTMRGLPGRGKYCSASCRSKVVVHSMLAVRGESWKRNVRAAMQKFRGANETTHSQWKGDSVGYYGVHDWITKHYGQPLECEWCGRNDPKRKYHWANISKTYKRRRDDFLRMCVPCHRRYDYADRRTT